MSCDSDPAAPPPPPDLDRIRHALAGTDDTELQGRHAAVALVLAGATTDLHLCLIHRAEHEADRWSGHMALPGGRVDPGDASARAAAIRETREEVGLRLDRATYLGSLPSVPVSSGGRPTGMSLFPFVFHLGETLEPLTPNDEVADAFWVPLGHLLDSRNAAYRATLRDGVALDHPAVLYNGHYVWGLTYRVLGTFFDHLHLKIAGL